MSGRVQVLVVAAVALASGCRRTSAIPRAAAEPHAVLRFVREGQPVATLTERTLETAAPPERVTAFDPYYQRQKSWRALPMARVLSRGFPGVDVAAEQLILRARDGYTVPIAGAELVDDGCYLAVADEDVPGWEPIGPQRADPGPFYVVWKKDDQQDLRTHPRPWQLEAIEIARAEILFPHAVPSGVAADSPAMRGFRRFFAECIRCHAINREGGHVGPDLNVPKSVVEYRTEREIREYIVNPLALRYGNMPAHPHLRRDDLDALIAYFHAMRERKWDPK